MWDVASGKSVATAKLPAEELYTVDWSPKGDLLVTAGSKAKIVVWEPKELKPLKELDAPDWVIRRCFSPSGPAAAFSQPAEVSKTRRTGRSRSGA